MAAIAFPARGVGACMMTVSGGRRGRGKSARSEELIVKAREILAAIQPASVRAVCYQLFTADVIPSMARNETNRVSRLLTDAREAGRIPWGWIVDETREPERVSAWDNPSDYAETVKRAYRRNRWTDQPDWIELWSEKGTVRGALAPVLNQYGLTFRVMHGHGSATAVHDAASESSDSEKQLTVFYVGDWDPSGLHMSEIDLPRRLKRYDGNVNLIRLAIAPEDAVPELPWFDARTKQHDPRYRWYVEKYGFKSWELDALNPVILRQRVENAIRARLDLAAWHRAEVAEAAELESLKTILSTWPTISRQASK
jgi:hypothetical protein